MHKHAVGIGAGVVFLTALVLYSLTVAPSVVLWDSGEFIASAFGLQVMHPPGAPIYLLIGRLFAMLGGAAPAALAVNLVSVVSASVTVLLVYLIVIRLIRRSGERATWTAVAGGVVGALTLAVSDTFWFNAVEAEVYALATLFIAVIAWLALRWADQVAEIRARGETVRASWSGNRYLVLMGLLAGLSIGVHLMSLLTYFFIVPIVFFTLADRPEWRPSRRILKMVGWFSAGTLGFVAIYPGMVILLPAAAGSMGSPLLALVAVSLTLTAGLFFTYRRRLALAHLTLLCAAAVLIGYSSYALIPIRSAVDPAIDLNDPETTDALVSYLKREQYGDTPLLQGPTYDDRTGRVDIRNVSLLPRRYSTDPVHLARYRAYRSDLDYFVRYQLGHMYLRYFMWNFAGRAHDTQHAGWITGIAAEGNLPYVYQTPSERESRNTYFALPLLLGLLGFAFQLRSDWRSGLSVACLFVVLGAGLVVYLNEVPVTPRERDYIYVGSFLVFGIWIGIGAAATIRFARKVLTGVRGRLAAAGLGTLLAAAVPGWMATQNYGDHDRSGNFAAHDYAYNLLMSVEKDAILFTGGDNDTYPLWYLQAVEGIRRDVRVVCLPLLQTRWYARQLKNQSAYDAERVPISLTDEQLDRLRPTAWEPREIALPVDASRLLRRPALRTAVEDTNGFESPMRWRLEGRHFSEELRYLTPADQVILDILATNAREGWGRPIYFAASSAEADRLDLGPYLQREGLAYRVVPIRHEEPGPRVVPSIMAARLDRFRFTNLDDPDVYYSEDERSLTGFSYRLAFAEASDSLLEHGDRAAARKMLTKIVDEVPGDTIPLHPYQSVALGQSFLRLGASSDAAFVVKRATPRLLHSLRLAESEAEMRPHLHVAHGMRRLLLAAKDFEAAAGLSNALADVLEMESMRTSPQELRHRFGALDRSS